MGWLPPTTIAGVDDCHSGHSSPRCGLADVVLASWSTTHPPDTALLRHRAKYDLAHAESGVQRCQSEGSRCASSALGHLPTPKLKRKTPMRSAAMQGYKGNHTLTRPTWSEERGVKLKLAR
jgi:hypothetical protein